MALCLVTISLILHFWILHSTFVSTFVVCFCVCLDISQYNGVYCCYTMSAYIGSYLIFSSIGDPHNQTTSKPHGIIRPPLYCSRLFVSRGVATIDRFYCAIRPPLLQPAGCVLRARRGEEGGGAVTPSKP